MFAMLRSHIDKKSYTATHTSLTCSAHSNPGVDSVVEKLMLSLDVHDRLEVLWRGFEDQPGIEWQGQVLIIQVITAGVGFSLGRCAHVHARVTAVVVSSPAFTRYRAVRQRQRKGKARKTESAGAKSGNKAETVLNLEMKLMRWSAV